MKHLNNSNENAINFILKFILLFNVIAQDKSLLYKDRYKHYELKLNVIHSNR